MTDPTAPVPIPRAPLWRAAGLFALAAAVVGTVYGGATGFCRFADDKPADPPPIGKVPTIGGQPIFSTWPAGVKPDAVVMLTGQTYGYVQPCGCTRPQKGGIERRANFVKSLKEKGWAVAAADLGDVYPDRHPLGPSGVVTPPAQALLKYKAAMDAMREMHYVAVGLGKSEFEAGVFDVLGAYALQKEQTPFVLAGNLKGKGADRAAMFPPPPGATRPQVGLSEAAVVGGVPVGFVGVVGPSLAKAVVGKDPALDFDSNKQVLADAIKELNARTPKPAVRVLLYQGTVAEATGVAKDWPQFQVILCQADDPEPPQFPQAVAHADGTKTLIVQVGHKGQYVGAVGVFKQANGTFDLKYQLVPLGEEYLTPDNPQAEKDNPGLRALDEYALQVKNRKFLEKVTPKPHPGQIQHPTLNLSYVGTDRCMGCHAGEHAKWKATPHGHALDALETVAKRPGLRNLDGECVVCHVVGYGYRTGYEDEVKTTFLKHVGCESCHGPGSGHMSAPRNAQLLAIASPWKQDPGDKLPPLATIKQIGEIKDPIARRNAESQLPPAQQRVINGVSRMCMSCHDMENDPHFEFYKYWPKVEHSGLAGGLPGGAAPPPPVGGVVPPPPGGGLPNPLPPPKP
jgi:hypothetical protein